MASQIWWYGCLDDIAAQGARRWKQGFKKDVCWVKVEIGIVSGSTWKKVVKPLQRRALAKEAVSVKAMSIRLACETFGISESCYRYQAKLTEENAVIAEWLIKLTHHQRSWGFGLCFLYLRNVKGFDWSHKHVYRIYRELELNLRIKPKKRLIREKPSL